MRSKIAILLAAIGLTACVHEKEKLGFVPEKPDIRGLATPIQLTGIETQVILEDYFLEVSKIDSINANSFLDVQLSNDKRVLTLTVKNEMLPGLSELKVWIQNIPYSIIIKKDKQLPVTFKFDPKNKKYKSVQVKGQFNDWNSSRNPLTFVNGLWQNSTLIKPGKYQYIYVIDGKEVIDPANDIRESNNMGGYNSVLSVGNTDNTKLPFIYTKSENSSGINLEYTNEVKEFFVLWENYRLPECFIEAGNSGLTITIPSDAATLKRSHIRVWAYNAFGLSNDLLIPLERAKVVTNTAKLTRSDKQAQIMYFLMVDRFNNGNRSNDQKVDDPEILPKANYYGGDLVGVTQKITDGYFESLGINTIWLSPITQNPLGAWGLNLNPRTKFSGYHGYWPVSLTKVDFRFGSPDDLHTLVQTAHTNDINVIQDYVANHVHQDHLLAKAHPEWFSSLYLPDGSMNLERWEEYRLTTWFDTFLPKFNFEKKEVYEPLSDTVLFWIKEYDLDGFRHDATKHIHENFWRRTTYKIKHQLPPDKSIFQIGETYGGPGLINSYIGSGLLDSQFDFNVYDAALSSIANPDGSFESLNARLMESLEVYGYHNMMGYISGNQDRGRFISYAGGSLKFDENAKYAGWTREIGVGDPVGYKRLCMLNAFNMTIPGIPTIYYGDEFGLPGGNDPDNRRMMKFDGLTDDEKSTLETTKKLVHLRRDNMALNYGDFSPLLVNQDIFAYSRCYFNNRVIVVFNKSNVEKDVQLVLPSYIASPEYSVSFGSRYSYQGNNLTLTLSGNSFEILVAK